MAKEQAPTEARPGDYVVKDISGRVIRVSKHFMSAGPASVYRVNDDRTLERLYWA